MTETITMSGSLNGAYLPAQTAESVLSAFGCEIRPYYFSDYAQGVPCDDNDYYWLRDHHCSVWENYEWEGDEYGARLEDRRRRRLFAPDEYVVVLYRVTDHRAHMQMMTVLEVNAFFQSDSYAYRIIVTR